MTASIGFAPGTGQDEAADEPVGSAPAIVRLTVTTALIAALVFNFVLCFVNTRVTPVTSGSVMLSEMLIITIAMAAALTRRAPLYLLIAAFVSYMMFLFALRGGQYDLKSIRDILIPITFYFAGMRIHDPKLGDRLVLASALIVVAAALFEYLLVDTFISYFNVIGYYVARGTVSVDQLYGQTQGLFISGTRAEPRTILPFLGPHRVSSVFLEPVSMGNFAVVVYSWALYRGREMAWRWWLMALAFSLIALADARFGLYTCVLITLLYPFFNFVPRPVWAMLPFLLLAVVGIYGITWGSGGGPNDLAGRFAVTAHILTQLPFSVVMGVEVTDQFTSDSGLAHTLTAFGLLGFIGLWTLFVHAPLAEARAWRFHSMVIVYLLLLMLISDSFYSIKTAALLWFLLGTSNAFRAAPGASSAAERKREPRPSLGMNAALTA